MAALEIFQVALESNEEVGRRRRLEAGRSSATEFIPAGYQQAARVH